MKIRTAVPALSLAVVLAACGEPPLTSGVPVGPPLAQITDGSGLVLHSLTGLSLPLIGHVGDVNIDQAIITHIDLVENTSDRSSDSGLMESCSSPAASWARTWSPRTLRPRSRSHPPTRSARYSRSTSAPSPSTHWLPASTCPRRPSKSTRPEPWGSCCAS